MTLRLGIFIFLILGIFFSIGMNQSHALSCGVPKFSEAYSEHDLLLHGNLIEKKIDYGENAPQKLATLVFEPIKVYKGTHNEKFTIQADLYWDDYYREGSDYILFADRDGENYLRELCVGDYLSSPSIINFLNEFLQNPEVAQDVSLLYDVTSETERKILDDTLKQYSILNREEELNPKLDFDNAILEPFADSDLVIVGKIIDVNKIVSENKTKYDIQVQEYLKNSRSFGMITVFFDGMQPEDFSFPGPITYYNQPFFEKENHVFVYLNEENGQFKISPYSFAIEKNEPKGPPPDILYPSSPQEFKFKQGEEITISGLIKKAYLYLSEQRGKDSSLILTILDKNDETIISEKLDVKVDGTYEFPFQLNGEPRIPGKYSYEISYGSGTLHDEFIIDRVPSLWTPLKQIKNGVALIDVTCNEGKHPSYKGDRMRVACVSEETQSELWLRGWSTNRLIMPSENISHALCNNYEGKWHPEYDGCRGDISDLQCSLMGGEFIDGLKICYNGICPIDKTYSLCVTNFDLYLQYPNETMQEFRQRCGPSATLRGPGPTPMECNSNLIQCNYVCGEEYTWIFHDSYGKLIDQKEAIAIIENEN